MISAPSLHIPSTDKVEADLEGPDRYIPPPYVKRLFLDGPLGSKVMEVRENLKYFPYFDGRTHYVYGLACAEDGHQFFKKIYARDEV